SGVSKFIYPLSTTVKSYLRTSTFPDMAPAEWTTVKSDFTYDDKGNPTDTVVTTTASPSGERYSKEIQNEFGAEGSAEQQLGKVTQTIVTTKRLDVPTMPIVHVTAFEYQATTNTFTEPMTGRSISALALYKKKVEPKAVPMPGVIQTPDGMEVHTALAYDGF